MKSGLRDRNNVECCCWWRQSIYVSMKSGLRDRNNKRLSSGSQSLYACLNEVRS